jgi:hypothetical protein
MITYPFGGVEHKLLLYPVCRVNRITYPFGGVEHKLLYTQFVELT